MDKHGEILWAAGLFEGEGSCCLGTSGVPRKADGKRSQTPKLSIGMTDLDVLERFCLAVGEGKVYGPYARGDNKPIYHWSVTWAAARRVMTLLYPHLGARRRAKAQEVFGYEDF